MCPNTQTHKHTRAETHTDTTNTHGNMPAQTHAHPYNRFGPLRTGRTGPWQKGRDNPLFPPPQIEVVSNSRQCLAEKLLALYWPNYRGLFGPAQPAQPLPIPLRWVLGHLWPGRFPDMVSIRPQLPGRAVAFEVAAEAGGRLFFSHLSPLIFPGSWPVARHFYLMGIK